MKMRLLIPLLLTLAPAPLLADYHGCGSDFATCASARVVAMPLPNGHWRVRITVLNLSYGGAAGAQRNSLLYGIYLGGLEPTANPRWGGVTDAAGASLDGYFTACGGCGFSAPADSYGGTGYKERLDPQTGETTWGGWAGSFDPQCAIDPACDALRRTGFRTPEVTEEWRYVPGGVTLTIDLSSWDPGTTRVFVAQTAIGGTAGFGYEEYELTGGAVTVTPEPGTLVLLGTGLAAVAFRRRRGPPVA